MHNYNEKKPNDMASDPEDSHALVTNGSATTKKMREPSHDSLEESGSLLSDDCSLSGTNVSEAHLSDQQFTKHDDHMAGTAIDVSRQFRHTEQLAGVVMNLSSGLMSARLAQSLGGFGGMNSADMMSVRLAQSFTEMKGLSTSLTSLKLAQSCAGLAGLSSGLASAKLARSLTDLTGLSSGLASTKLARSLADVTGLSGSLESAKLARSFTDLSGLSPGLASAKLARSLTDLSGISSGLASAKLARSLTDLSGLSLGLASAKLARSLTDLTGLPSGLASAKLARSLADVRGLSASLESVKLARSLNGVTGLSSGLASARMVGAFAEPTGFSSSLASVKLARSLADTAGLSSVLASAKLAHSLSGMTGLVASLTPATLAGRVAAIAAFLGPLAQQVHLAERAIFPQEQVYESLVEKISEERDLPSGLETSSDSPTSILPADAAPRLLALPAQAPALLQSSVDWYAFDEETVPAQAPDSYSRQVALLQAMAEPAYLDFARRELSQPESQLLKWLTPSYYDVIGLIITLTSMSYSPVVIGVMIFLLVRLFLALSLLPDRKNQ